LLANKYHLEDYVDLLIESFKKNRNLPYKIKSGKSCPDKKKNCRKKHGEIIIKEYDKKQKKFHVYHYAIHNPKSVFDWWQEEKKIKELVMEQNKTVSYGYSLMRLLDIKKTLDKNTNRYRSENLQLRATVEEIELLRKNAKKNDMKFSDYIREKLFS